MQRETQEIARTLKCPVCESQSVADSPSQLAQEMRGYIERRLDGGESRDAIVQDLTDRYGEGIRWSRLGAVHVDHLVAADRLLAIGAAIVGLTLRRVTRRPQPVKLAARRDAGNSRASAADPRPCRPNACRI